MNTKPNRHQDAIASNTLLRDTLDMLEGLVLTYGYNADGKLEVYVNKQDKNNPDNVITATLPIENDDDLYKDYV